VNAPTKNMVPVSSSSPPPAFFLRFSWYLQRVGQASQYCELISAKYRLYKMCCGPYPFSSIVRIAESILWAAEKSEMHVG
jgi:hypothetical protein